MLRDGGRSEGWEKTFRVQQKGFVVLFRVPRQLSLSARLDLGALDSRHRVLISSNTGSEASSLTSKLLHLLEIDEEREMACELANENDRVPGKLRGCLICHIE